MTSDRLSWCNSKLARAAYLCGSGMSWDEIGAELGCSGDAVRVHLGRYGLRRRSRDPNSIGWPLNRLEPAARARGISVTDLVARIVGVLAADLEEGRTTVDAVLDDGVSSLI
ncbi:hypothetical protein L0F51_00160 [Afifella sp. H1R]|uniref:hypothetical protein n=1 Tax=Afifella sp. H1R TaxID=2908841 RepID=UPI001F16B815|nr:hypothetical protein [Afifella sp. H1R]MCF1502178.1 hypothetical protein [Afifella sp. H1R]